MRYPILPKIERALRASGYSESTRQEILHIRHHSLFAPCDFDLSPYFKIVKPGLENSFDHRDLVWADALASGPAELGRSGDLGIRKPRRSR
jgi:hypothetical protein